MEIRKAYAFIAKHFPSKLGPVLIHTEEKVKRSMNGVVPDYSAYIYFGPYQRDTTAPESQRVVPACQHTIYAKNVDAESIICSCFISDYAIARVLMRSSPQNLSDIFDAISEFVVFATKMTVEYRLPDEDFILVSNEAYMPFGIVDDVGSMTGNAPFNRFSQM